jgi:predicted PurR-regulated permease PerM
MLGLDQRALKIVWTVFLFALAVVGVYVVRHTLVTFALALFLAHLITPIVTLVDRFTPAQVPRNAALAFVYVVLIGALIAIMIPLGSAIGEDAASLARRLPDLLKDDPLERLPLPSWLEPIRARLAGAIAQWLTQVSDNAVPLISRLAGQLLSGIGVVVSAVLIPILAFFFVKDGKTLRREILTSFPQSKRPLVGEILSDLHLLLAQYIRALVILSMAAFVAYVAFLGIVGAPYAVLLAGMGAVLEFIPAVGPFLGAVTIMIVAGTSGYSHWFLIFIFLTVYRIFQDYVLSPALMSAGVQVHPLLVLFGVLCGAEIAGVPGIFFSVPVIAALRLIVVRLRRRSSAT